MRDDFCAFILTHGRPDRVYTYDALMRCGYTGKVFILIDDEDKTANEYRARFGDKVLVFCKSEIAKTTDPGDNFGSRASTIYARNAMHETAKSVGCKYFIQLDDDYTGFLIRHDSSGKYLTGKSIRKMDSVMELLLQFFLKTQCTSVAMSQGGDWIGGGGDANGNGGCPIPRLARKAMNSFICSVDRPLQFFGTRNEDVNAYVTLGLRGQLFFTVMQSQLVQLQSQSNPGAITSAYLESGTYVKSFYTVMYAPSCCKIGMMGDPRGGERRIHHKINWNNCSPKILREEFRKPETRCAHLPASPGTVCQVKNLQPPALPSAKFFEPDAMQQCAGQTIQL